MICNFRVLVRATIVVVACVVTVAVRADVIIDWNAVYCDVVKADGASANPGWSSRAVGMLNAAMFDAVNSIENASAPFVVAVPSAADTSREAAAAQAAYRVLLNLYPNQQTTLDARLANSLASIADSPQKSAGIALGDTVGQAVIQSRANDGANLVVPYSPGIGPGQWRPDPMNPGQQAWGPQWGAVKPFVMTNSGQFAPPLVPALNSPEYTAAFNEVKSLGAKNSATRTAEQTQIGLFWAYDRPGMGPPMVLYDQVLMRIAAARNNSLSDNARLFGLAGVAMADAGIAAWDSKFAQNFWRPITAIREADTDGNPNTIADPNWTPLGAPGGGVINDFTPPFPAYVSGHATFGAAMFRILADFYGSDQFEFDLSSDELPGVTRHFSSFSQASAENARSRIYLGIHWSFDDEQGRALGIDIADWVFGHAMTVPEPGTFASLAIGALTLLFFGKRRLSSRPASV